MERFFLKKIKDVEVRQNYRGYKQVLGANNREKTKAVTQTTVVITYGSRINRGFMMNTQNYQTKGNIKYFSGYNIKVKLMLTE